MMEKIIKILKKYKIVLISLLLLLIVVFIIFQKRTYISHLETKYYTIQYDSTWKMKLKEETKITLKHRYSDAKIVAEIVSLSQESQYNSIDELIDEISYNIETQNEKYKLLSKKKTTFTKSKLDGYKMLYERDSSQVMITTFKKGSQLIIISYEAKNQCFDILLDSVQNIIYNFESKEETFNLKKSINLELQNIELKEDKKLDSLLNQNDSYEIASNHFYVSYAIPSNFQLRNLNSNGNYFNLDLEEGNIRLDTSILNRNIYEYLDRDNRLNLYKSYDIYKKNEDYSNYQEIVSKLKTSDYESYIYKNSYLDKNGKSYENVELIYALDKNHIFVVKLVSKNLTISEKLINKIKINKAFNYSSYTDSKIENNKIISILKRFSDYDKNNYEEIKITLPDKYVEFDKDNNLYEQRSFKLNYNEKIEMYDYEINYKLTNTIISNIDNQLSIINNLFPKAYGECNYLTYWKDMIINEKNFSIYSGGYTNLGGIMFTDIDRYKYYVNKKVLFYKMERGGYLIIEISGNAQEITDEILNEVTNFVIEEKSRKKE